MKLVYPVVINTSKEKSDEYYSVYIPDLDIYTEGKDLADCIEMARDAIGINCLTLEESLFQNNLILILLLAKIIKLKHWSMLIMTSIKNNIR